jgi:membrane-bound lytic murein transglycosylase D
MERERQSIKHEHGLKPRERRVRAQRGVKDRFALGLSRSQKHMDQIQQIFEEEGLPRELAYLPLVESFFDTSARSRVGAVGMWQFMRPTGQQFLKINNSVDERKDPLDSTRGAARLLKRNYQALGNWPLAVTAYNHGRDGMLRAVREVGTTDLVEIIRVHDSRTFGFVSKNFYAEFLAALEVVKESHEHFPELEYHPPFTLHELELARSISVAALLKPLAVSRKEFFQWNPALNPRTEQIPKGYRVKVPAEKLDVFPPAFRRLAATEPVQAGSRDGDRTSHVRHRVTRGETLWEIAKAYDTTVAAISRVNGIHRAHTLAIGQQLTIPRP